jgi:hypothetical protein
MRKLITGLTVVTLLAVGALAYGHGFGFGGGNMMGPGYGGHMMAPGYGGHMMGQGMAGYGFDKKFLDETADLRRDLHEKRFEYSEALRDTDTTPKTIAKLEEEIRGLQEKIREKSPRTAYGYGRTGGFGCW